MPDNGDVLEARYIKGGISRLAPPRPQAWVQSLPPILNRMSQTPISSCSKGARGLSVFLRVLGIFTETLISPSPSLRQRPSRYAIRAGRNLPDKEFRSREPPCRHGARTISSAHGRRESVGVWPLRILISSSLGFWRFIVSVILAISIKPSAVR